MLGVGEVWYRPGTAVCNHHNIGCRGATSSMRLGGSAGRWWRGGGGRGGVWGASSHAGGPSAGGTAAAWFTPGAQLLVPLVRQLLKKPQNQVVGQGR